MAVDAQTQLGHAKELIKAKRYSEARQVLSHVDHPTAIKWLEKLDEIEMFGAPITSASPAPTDIKLKRQTQRADMLLQEAVAIFINHDWEMKMQMQGVVHLEKKHAPSNLTSFIVIAVFGLLGMLFVIIDIANSKVERVALQATDDEQLKVSGSKGVFVTSDPTRVYALAQSVKKGATYAGAIALGLVSSGFWFVCLSTLLTPRYYY